MESLEDLATWRSQLNEEEEFIMKMLTEIDEQINCLQVEQMELASFRREKENQSYDNKLPKMESSKQEICGKLDLTIPIIKKQDTDEEEEEEEEDDQ